MSARDGLTTRPNALGLDVYANDPPVRDAVDGAFRRGVVVAVLTGERAPDLDDWAVWTLQASADHSTESAWYSPSLRARLLDEYPGEVAR